MTDTKTLAQELRDILANGNYPQKIANRAADRLEELERENTALKRLYTGKLLCGHLRQFGTSGEVTPIKCCACENAALREKIKTLEATLIG